MVFASPNPTGVEVRRTSKAEAEKDTLKRYVQRRKQAEELEEFGLAPPEAGTSFHETALGG